MGITFSQLFLFGTSHGFFQHKSEISFSICQVHQLFSSLTSLLVVKMFQTFAYYRIQYPRIIVYFPHRTVYLSLLKDIDAVDDGIEALLWEKLKQPWDIFVGKHGS